MPARSSIRRWWKPSSPSLAAAGWRNSLPKNKKLRSALVWGTAAVVAAGFVPWRVTVPPADWRGWQVASGEARWTPWSRLKWSNLEVRTPVGGRLRLNEVEVRPRLWTLALGRWEMVWRFGEVRVDPDSWGIRQQPAREILSTGQAADGGSAVVQIRPGRWTLRRLELEGPFLRLNATGWLSQGRGEAELALKGELRSRLLQGGEFRPWEPFELQVHGALPAPAIRFTSSFFTFSVSPQTERRS